MNLYDSKVWRKGCKYVVSYPNQLCLKCGHKHDQTAYEAEHSLLNPKEKPDVEPNRD